MTAPTWVLAGGPIDDRPTFLAHALALSALHGPGPWPDGGNPLPDEPPSRTGDGVVIPSAVLDGIRTHHFSAEPDPVAATDIADLFVRLTSRSPDRRDLTELCDRLAAQRALSIADALVEELRRRRPPSGRLRELARHLAEHGSRRDVVKVGIIVLGVTGDVRDRELLLLLGAIEEFTLFAAVALLATQPDGRRAVYDLARRVDGWGRIHAVERLKGSDDPEIKAWLLREGFRNGVMYEYLAHVAATTGDLYSALLEAEVDDALLDGAGDILSALALGGPAKDMTDYAEAVPAMHRYAEVLAGAEPTLDRLGDLLTVAGFVRDPGERFTWPDGEPARLRARYTELLDRPIWRDLVLAGLAHPVGPYGFEKALSAARDLGGIAALPYALSHLAERDPFDAYVWQCAVAMADAQTITAVTGLAEALLPLDELASGPGDALGIGAAHTADRALEAVLTGLDEHPGAGIALIGAALTSRVIRIRHGVLRVLAAWPADAVPAELLGRLAEAKGAEPDAKVRRDMEDVLSRGKTDGF